MASTFSTRLIVQAHRQTPIPGLAVAWVRSGEEPLFQCSGESRPGTLVTADTVFPVASITKTFTASLCALKVESGAWRWDSRVRDLWPDFALHDADAAARMTLLDALTHRSGLPPHTWAWVFARPDRGAYMRERLPHLASTGRFDEKVRYSNLMFALAGWLYTRAPANAPVPAVAEAPLPAAPVEAQPVPAEGTTTAIAFDQQALHLMGAT